ncbi:hypothetical protein bcgnr5411_41890 [Bacillus cereus]
MWLEKITEIIRGYSIPYRIPEKILLYANIIDYFILMYQVLDNLKFVKLLMCLSDNVNTYILLLSQINRKSTFFCILITFLVFKGL